MKRKGKIFAAAVVLAVLCFCLGVNAATVSYQVRAFVNTACSVVLNGTKLNMKDDAGKGLPPLMFNENMYVPVRPYAKAMGADVGWNSSTRTVTVTAKPRDTGIYQDTGIKLVVNKKTQSVPVLSCKGTNYVPVRTLANLLGASVTWNGAASTIGITASATQKQNGTTAKYNLNAEPVINLGKNGYAWPLPGGRAKYTLTSYFGKRNCPFHGEEVHYAIDISAVMGTPILATKSGTVEKSATDNSQGNYLVLYHDDGTASRYCHMVAPGAPAGTYVKQGQCIGYVGMTGDATGYHLHFGINNQHTCSTSTGAVDPLLYF